MESIWVFFTIFRRQLLGNLVTGNNIADKMIVKQSFVYCFSKSAIWLPGSG